MDIVKNLVKPMKTKTLVLGYFFQPCCNTYKKLENACSGKILVSWFTRRENIGFVVADGFISSACIFLSMPKKIPCRYCGTRCHPRKLKQHEQECKKDQKGDATADKPKTFPKECIIRTCCKCGAQTGFFVLDGAKCKECGADL